MTTTGDTAVTVLLAEYESLRAEMGRRAQAQNTLMGLALTTSGGVLAYGLGNRTLAVLLLHPLIAGGFGLLWADNAFAKECIARYIQHHTEPLARTLTNLSDVMHWQSQEGERARGWRVFWLVLPAFTFAGGPAGTLALTKGNVFGATRAESVAAGEFAVSHGVVQAFWVMGVVVVTVCVVAFCRAFIHRFHNHGDYTACGAPRPRDHADDEAPAGP